MSEFDQRGNTNWQKKNSQCDCCDWYLISNINEKIITARIVITVWKYKSLADPRDCRGCTSPWIFVFHCIMFFRKIYQNYRVDAPPPTVNPGSDTENLRLKWWFNSSNWKSLYAVYRFTRGLCTFPGDRCDGFADCTDLSDEQGCGCPSGFFQ